MVYMYHLSLFLPLCTQHGIVVTDESYRTFRSYEQRTENAYTPLTHHYTHTRTHTHANTSYNITTANIYCYGTTIKGNAKRGVC